MGRFSQFSLRSSGWPKKMRSAKRTSSPSCSDSLRNPDSRLTDMPWPEVTSSQNLATRPGSQVLGIAVEFGIQLSLRACISS
jgi:hypothetical protein